MAYNKKAHLQTNIEAIKIAFMLDREKRKASEAERAILQLYSGFGGIKCILNPTQTEKDREYWTKSDLDMFPTVADLHRIIRDNSKDEQEYKHYYNSLKSSVLTAFYTPPEIIKAISDTLNEKGVVPARFLDPSAGNGAFADNFKESFPTMETVCFEKDLLTGKILSHLQPEDKIHIRGFEEIENRPDNQFDIVSSNIPFGDVSVFDTAFSNSKDPARRQASRTVHNYFFSQRSRYASRRRTAGIYHFAGRNEQPAKRADTPMADAEYQPCFGGTFAQQSFYRTRRNRSRQRPDYLAKKQRENIAYARRTGICSKPQTFQRRKRKQSVSEFRQGSPYAGAYRYRPIRQACNGFHPR
jgi:hypothetical protein